MLSPSKHKNLIQSSFNKAAEHYDQYANLQQSIGERLLQLLKTYPIHPGRAIDLGCGTGKLTQLLSKTISFNEFHAIDISQTSLEKAKNHLLHALVYQADFDALTPDKKGFDMIFSNMALHWSKQFFITLPTLLELLNVNGILAFTLPLAGTFNELEREQYSCQSFIAETTLNQYLAQLPYPYEIDLEYTQLKFNHTLDALRSIKNVGANHVEQRLYKSLRGKSFLQNKPITCLTYKIAYVIIQKI